jgi:23S rRNA (guanine2445-N2)-methyltransferase / 23S rRNA (guanine2069-N7)-methyltransferase
MAGPPSGGEMRPMDRLELIATSTAGLEACVKHELVALGFTDARIYSPGRLIFTTDAVGLARANLWLRTANRVLLKVGSFPAEDFDQLFDGIRELPWEQWIPADGTLPVTGRSYKSQLTSVPAIQRTAKKAIVERLLKAHSAGDLPETGPSFAIEVAVREDVATLTMDTSGGDLHRRGYRAAAGPAPLKETLASALIQLSFWKPDRPLIDPFCGSGTIPIEAAMIGRNMAPGLYRDFAAEDWPALARQCWSDERARAQDLILPPLEQRIIGTDIEPKGVSLSRYHAELAGVDGDVHFQAAPFAELTSNREYGCVICNPPYGHRFASDRGGTPPVYAEMPDVFRQLKSWSFYVLTSVDLEEALGQTADRRRKLYNGRIECTYYQYHGPRPPRRLTDEEKAERRAEHEQRIDQPDDSTPAPAPAPTPAPAPAAFGGLKDNAADQAEMFANRLRKNARQLRRWPTRKNITCYRLYDRDIPEVPLAVDLYEGHLHIAEYDRPHDRTAAQHADWLELIASTAGEVMEIAPANIHLKRRERQKGTEQYNKFGDAGCVTTVHEGGLEFEVNLSDYLDTGLFLDHRITRNMVREEAEGKRVLNLFGYTGAFTVYAAAGGASATMTVDLSRTYLTWANRNLLANRLASEIHDFARVDAMAFLREADREKKYDLAIIDPPTFSNSKRTDDVFDVQRDHVTMLRATHELMSPGGVIYFSTNSRRFKLAGEAMVGFDIQDISAKTIPEDFRNKRIHQCWRMVVK